ncbi:MAG TPA: PLP-dependent transferase [Burkholderiaceae bacterium]|nr:PLP-dependent transferase [Burkholderiaceae bacterium]
MSPGADQDISTRLIHHPYRAPEDFESPAVPVAKASTVFFPTVADLRARTWLDRSGYTYGLHGTPTTFTLEERIATLEGGRHTMLVPSGLAAIAMVDIALLTQGDHLLLPDNVYGPHKALTRHEVAAWGVTHTVYDPMDPGSLAEAIRPSTRLVWLEAPGSVTLEFPDLRSLVRIVRERAPQAWVALDNTWGAGLAFDAFDLAPGLGVDLTIHALTKYPSGGGDVLMGAVTCRDDGLYRRLALSRSRQGQGVGANDVEAILRALPSMPLRYAAQDAAARTFAAWCETKPAFVRVLHPALPGSPGHANWALQCRAAAGLLAVELDPRFSPAQADAFVDALHLFRIGWSWGGPVSLAVPYDVRSLRERATAYRGTVVRFSMGLEAVEDLIADAEQALAALPG